MQRGRVHGNVKTSLSISTNLYRQPSSKWKHESELSPGPRTFLDWVRCQPMTWPSTSSGVDMRSSNKARAASRTRPGSDRQQHKAGCPPVAQSVYVRRLTGWFGMLVSHRGWCHVSEGRAGAKGAGAARVGLRPGSCAWAHRERHPRCARRQMVAEPPYPRDDECDASPAHGCRPASKHFRHEQRC